MSKAIANWNKGGLRGWRTCVQFSAPILVFYITSWLWLIRPLVNMIRLWKWIPFLPVAMWISHRWALAEVSRFRVSRQRECARGVSPLKLNFHWLNARDSRKSFSVTWRENPSRTPSSFFLFWRTISMSTVVSKFAAGFNTVKFTSQFYGGQ